MNKKVVMIALAIVLLAAGAGGGFLAAKYAGGNGASAGRMGPGGAFAQLTDSERQQLQNMSDTERQQFFKEKGIDMPTGGPNGTAGGAGFRGGRGGAIVGKVTAMDAETVTIELTAGGSQKVYLSDDTVTAFEAGSSGTLAVGSNVMAFAQPEAEGVNTAQAIVVKK